MKIQWDSLCGWMCGVILVVIVGKLWIAPQLDWLEVLWAVLKGQMGL